ncbi:hypothetical protein A2U01_0080641, partial [Trifolium medium]|nr:hypothetical protein [Trifolium medium]
VDDLSAQLFSLKLVFFSSPWLALAQLALASKCYVLGLMKKT